MAQTRKSIADTVKKRQSVLSVAAKTTVSTRIQGGGGDDGTELASVPSFTKLHSTIKCEQASEHLWMLTYSQKISEYSITARRLDLVWFESVIFPRHFGSWCNELCKQAPFVLALVS